MHLTDLAGHFHCVGCLLGCGGLICLLVGGFTTGGSSSCVGCGIASCVCMACTSGVGHCIDCAEHQNRRLRRGRSPWHRSSGRRRSTRAEPHQRCRPPCDLDEECQGMSVVATDSGKMSVALAVAASTKVPTVIADLIASFLACEICGRSETLGHALRLHFRLLRNKLQAGDKVRCHYRTHGRKSSRPDRGTIDRVNDDKTMDITFDDGARQARIPRDWAVWFKPQPAARVPTSEI